MQQFNLVFGLFFLRLSIDYHTISPLRACSHTLIYTCTYCMCLFQVHIIFLLIRYSICICTLLQYLFSLAIHLYMYLVHTIIVRRVQIDKYTCIRRISMLLYLCTPANGYMSYSHARIHDIPQRDCSGSNNIHAVM